MNVASLWRWLFSLELGFLSLLFHVGHSSFSSLCIFHPINTFSCKANMFALSPKRLLSPLLLRDYRPLYQESCCIYTRVNRTGQALCFKQLISFVLCVWRRRGGGKREPLGGGRAWERCINTFNMWENFFVSAHEHQKFAGAGRILKEGVCRAVSRALESDCLSL